MRGKESDSKRPLVGERPTERLDESLVASRYTPAALNALECFSIEPEDIKLVAHSENVTFRVSPHGGDTDYVLKLHRPGYNSIEELYSERLWGRSLREAGLIVPDSCISRQGKNFELIEIPGTNEQRYAGITTWFDGTLLGDHLEDCADGEARMRIFRQIGGIAAAIHNQSMRWKEPPGFTRRRLDIDGLLGEAPVWGRFWEHAELTGPEQALLLRARKRARMALSTYGEGSGNFSLIHADLHPENFVRNGDQLALIDFDDAAYGWHMYDIASAILEDVRAADFDAIFAAVLDGYGECRPLASRDVAMLRTFLLIRGMAIIGWLHQRPEHAGSEFFEYVKNWVVEECSANKC